MSALGCLSVAGRRTSMALLERVSFSADELAQRLPRLRSASGATGLAVLSTCQRTELYACWPGTPDPAALLRALAEDRGLSPDEIRAAGSAYREVEAARHLLRVATGLESFVLGETEITGQVRAAAAAMHGARTGEVELDRLFAAAVSASRRAHRGSSLARTGRSVASAAVDVVAARNGGSLTGRQVLVVGAGSVACAVATRAGALGATLTVANRTRRHAEQLARAGARVVDLAALPSCLARADVAILATAAPRPLVDRPLLEATRAGRRGSLLLLDLCLPRNVAPSVRTLPGVCLMDLADLRAAGAASVEEFEGDVAGAEQAVEQELGRYLRWRSVRAVRGQPVVAVSRCGVPTGLDSGEPRSRR